MARVLQIVAVAALGTACSSSSDSMRLLEVSPSNGMGGAAGAPGTVSTSAAGGVNGSAGAPIFHVDAGVPTRSGCNDINVGFEKLLPTVILLVDESGSMSDNKYPAGGTQSRWRVLHDALLADGGLVQILASEIRFGFIGYTGDGTQATCPILKRTSIFAAGPDGAALAAMRGVYPAERPSLPYSGDTPTGAALRAATAALLADSTPGPKYVLLATDGDPDTCAKPNPQCGQDEAVSAAQDARAAGVSTFVLGISDDVASWHLQQMANAGAGLDVPPPDSNFYNTCPRDPAVTPHYAASAPGQNARFYKPPDGAELSKALSTILNGARTCTFTLHGEVAAGKESRGMVRLDGLDLGYAAPDGWRLDDPRTLEVLGASCDKIKTTSKLLEVSFPCDTVTNIR